MRHERTEESTASEAGKRVNRRRRRAIIGAAGLVTAGASALLLAHQLADHEAGTHDAAAPALLRSASVGADHSPASPPAGTLATTAAPVAGSSSGAPGEPLTTQQRVDALRGTAKKNAKYLVKRPIVTADHGVTDAELRQRTTGSPRGGNGTIRVVSASRDLTGQRELSWAAGQGERVGDADCTQDFRFTVGAPAVEKPTLLLCWRTSAAKSVYTVAVNTGGRPSKRASVAAIDEEWARIG